MKFNRMKMESQRRFYNIETANLEGNLTTDLLEYTLKRVFKGKRRF